MDLIDKHDVNIYGLGRLGHPDSTPVFSGAIPKTSTYLVFQWELAC